MYESYINKIEDVGKLRNLKPGTIRIYKNNVTQFLEFIQKDPEDLTCKDASDFLLYLKNKGDKSSTLNNKARIESPYISATRTRLWFPSIILFRHYLFLDLANNSDSI